LEDALSLISGKKNSLAKVVQLVGWTDADLYSINQNTGRKQPSQLYAQVLRWKMKQANQQVAHIVQIPTIHDVQISSCTRPSLSPLSTSDSTLFESTSGSSSSLGLLLFPNQTRMTKQQFCGVTHNKNRKPEYFSKSPSQPAVRARAS
jgi:hypothetical protein